MAQGQDPETTHDLSNCGFYSGHHSPYPWVYDSVFTGVSPQHTKMASTTEQKTQTKSRTEQYKPFLAAAHKDVPLDELGDLYIAWNQAGCPTGVNIRSPADLEGLE